MLVRDRLASKLLFEVIPIRTCCYDNKMLDTIMVLWEELFLYKETILFSVCFSPVISLIQLNLYLSPFMTQWVVSHNLRLRFEVSGSSSFGRSSRFLDFKQKLSYEECLWLRIPHCNGICKRIKTNPTLFWTKE